MGTRKLVLTSPISLYKRLKALEAEVQECRQMNVRLAELCDVMMELILPATQRDESAIAEIVERYKRDIGTPV